AWWSGNGGSRWRRRRLRRACIGAEPVRISPISAISDAALQAEPATKARGYWTTVGRRIIRDKVSMTCACILIAIFLTALCASWLGLADPYQGSMIRRLRHIGTPNYPLGTDE